MPGGEGAGLVTLAVEVLLNLVFVSRHSDSGPVVFPGMSLLKITDSDDHGQGHLTPKEAWTALIRQ